MRIATQVGRYEIMPHSEDPSLLQVQAFSGGALQAAVDGIALIDGGEDPQEIEPWIVASRHAVAEWVAHEIRQYIVNPYERIKE